MIEKLTKKQEAAIIPYREKWINRILSTEQSDDEIKQNIRNIYKLVGLPEPKQVWIMDSMYGVQVAINWIKNNKDVKLDTANIGDNIRANIGDNIGDNIGANIWANIGDNIGDNIRANIGDNIRDNIRANIWANIGDNIGDNIWANIRDNIGDNIRANIGDNIGDNIWANIRDNIRDNIRANIWANIGDNIRDNIRANIWANIRDNIRANIWANIRDNKLEFFGFSDNEASYLHWYLYEKFFFEQGLLPEDKYSQQLFAYIEMAIDAWAVYYSNDIAIVSRKPTVKREDNRLHSDQLPAVSFKDGYELYYLDGVNLTKELWEKIVSKTMTFKEIMAIEISDQRTVALKYNPEAIIKENAQLVHKDHRNNELYLIESQQINKDLNFPKIWFLKMLCPTGRIFIEGVEPKFAEIHKNATECQAELCGLTLSEYQQMELES